MIRLIKCFALLLSLFFILMLFTACNPIDTNGVSLQDTRFIAHRGLSSIYYQNTKEAFLAAGESDFFYGIETDIRFTKDDIPVCAHDDDPFNDKSKLISLTDFSEAITLPLDPNKKGAAQMSSEYRLWDFVTYLDICMEYDKVAFIEIKGEPTYEQLESLVNIIRDKNAIYDCEIISFSYQNILNINKIESEIKTQILVSYALYARYYLLKGESIGINQKRVNQSIIRYAHKKGMKVNVWTVNDIESALKYIAMGADFITTDYIFND